jgi:hypothetical protein
LQVSEYRFWQTLWHFLCRPLVEGNNGPEDPGAVPLELPWLLSWESTELRSAGRGFSRADYRAARHRAQEAARATLGDGLWAILQQQGYLELPSQRVPGRRYRLRVGRRIEVRDEEGRREPGRRSFLCVNPRYPLPEVEFFAQLYLYLRDREEEVLAVAIPQYYDAEIGRTFS